MSDLEKILKSVVLGSVGAVATVVEKGGELAQALVEKGQATVDANRDTAEEWKKQFHDACEAAHAPDLDVSGLTREQRDALRRALDEADAAEAAQQTDDGANG